MLMTTHTFLVAYIFILKANNVAGMYQCNVPIWTFCR